MNKKIIEENFGTPTEIVKISGHSYYLEFCDKKQPMKLELFRETEKEINPFWSPGKKFNTVAPVNKLARSLPVHNLAMKLNARVPKIIKVVKCDDYIYKFTEWVQALTLNSLFEVRPDWIPLVCENLGIYMCELHTSVSFTPCDPHFKNFVWTDKGCVYVDMKKFLFTTLDVFLLQIGKICLKSCKGDRKKALYVLRGYSKILNVDNALEHLDTIQWKLGKFKIEPITKEEING